MPLTVSVFDAELNLTCKRNGEIEVVGVGKRADVVGLARNFIDSECLAAYCAPDLLRVARQIATKFGGHVVGEVAAIAQMREFWIAIIKKHASPDPSQARGERKGTFQVGKGLNLIHVWSGSQRYLGTELNLADPEHLLVVRGFLREKWIERKVRWENIRLISFDYRCLLFNR